MNDTENRHLSLGASLYVPATRADMAEIANGQKLAGLRSVIFCTEDAVRTDDVDLALRNLEAALPSMRRGEGPRRFVRVRNQHVLGRVLQMPGVSHVEGFVLPKITAANLPSYLDCLSGHDDAFSLMPTLETAEVFESADMRRLREAMSDDRVRRRILALRIGGNDLFNLLGIRRSPERTIYETALGHAIAMLATTFRPHGFALTGTVFEAMDRPGVLAREVVQDLDHGLFGKTAIHPDQAPVIEALYRPLQEDVEMARAILDPAAPAVFRMHGTMCEPATHRRAAADTLIRASLYGTLPAGRDRVATAAGLPHAA